MMISYKEVYVELRRITTIDLVSKSSNLLEKLLWSLIGIIGTIWAVYFITLQVIQLYSITNFSIIFLQVTTFLKVISWDESPSVLIQGNIETTDLKYPAVTICPKVSTRYGIVERLGNYINPLNLPAKSLALFSSSYQSHSAVF